MSNDFKIEFSLADQELRAAFARLREHCIDMTPLMETVSGHLHRASEDAFEHEADPNSGLPWAPLKPRTIAERERKGYWPGKKLQRTGLMAQSVVAEHGADFASIAVGQDYALWHQIGTQHMPARPILGMDDQAIEDILDATRAFLASAFDGATAPNAL